MSSILRRLSGQMWSPVEVSSVARRGWRSAFEVLNFMEQNFLRKNLICSTAVWGNWWKLDVWDSKIEGLEIVESLSSGFFFLLGADVETWPGAPVTSRLQQCHQCLWVVGDMETSGWSSVKWQVHLVIPPYPLVNSHNYGNISIFNR